MLLVVGIQYLIKALQLRTCNSGRIYNHRYVNRRMLALEKPVWRKTTILSSPLVRASVTPKVWRDRTEPPYLLLTHFVWETSRVLRWKTFVFSNKLRNGHFWEIWSRCMRLAWCTIQAHHISKRSAPSAHWYSAILSLKRSRYAKILFARSGMFKDQQQA